MKANEYVETLIVERKADHKKIMVNVGLDDYGQCFFFEFLDDNGTLTEIGCGSYNSEYEQVIEDWFNPPVFITRTCGDCPIFDPDASRCTRVGRERNTKANDECFYGLKKFLEE